MLELKGYLVRKPRPSQLSPSGPIVPNVTDLVYCILISRLGKTLCHT